ncbi:MAG: UDP-N-acetylmuramoyl-L-alanyl-D-glutamate--2,6-diaminopimelate ligase [Candidatus Omnitrophica bacterium]|nr:UDP-N-acetylmuramoyl-L-alanyl-D-glutamate--2,6-diaminopimelate ligase [Candidatus Omnitrophota bacterium]
MKNKNILIALEAIKFDPERVKIDSRNVKKGDLFIALKGTTEDGHIYVQNALDKGAIKILCDTRNKFSAEASKKIPDRIIKFTNTGAVLIEIMDELYPKISEKINIIGVTGTNGKTTTCFMIYQLLKMIGIPAGLITTVFKDLKGNGDLLPSDMTTPSIIELYSSINTMINNGLKTAVIEVSSHALSQKRLGKLKLDAAVFTNLTRDHLDYHGSMENYFNDKKKIFTYLKAKGKSIINISDPLLKKDLNNNRTGTISYSIGPSADLNAKNISALSDNTKFDIFDKGKLLKKCKIMFSGKHNVLNVLAAISAVGAIVNDKTKLLRYIQKLKGVPGRMETFRAKKGFYVYVDYAHTPDALENVISTVRNITKGRVITVFGCGGDRDPGKRPLMGKIASSLSDLVYLTSDNPRSENPKSIINAIHAGINKSCLCYVVEDRKKAILQAIDNAKKGDAVLIAGKGHENYQIKDGIKKHFSDKEEVIKAIKLLG